MFYIRSLDLIHLIGESLYIQFLCPFFNFFSLWNHISPLYILVINPISDIFSPTTKVVFSFWGTRHVARFLKKIFLREIRDIPHKERNIVYVKLKQNYTIQ